MPASRPRGAITPDHAPDDHAQERSGLEDWIKEAVIYRLDTPALGELLPHEDEHDDELRKLLEERTAQQQRLDGLAEDYSTGLLSREQLAKANVAGQNHLAALNQRIDELHRSRQAVNILPTGQTVRQAWDDCESDSWRRNLLKLLITEIRVHPDKSKPFYKGWRFNPASIEVFWRS